MTGRIAMTDLILETISFVAGNQNFDIHTRVVLIGALLDFAALRAAVERATPKMWPITDQPDEYARQKAIGHNQAITDYKANLERELFG